MSAVQSFEIGGVGNYDTQQIVVFTGHEVTLHDLWNRADGGLESGHVGPLLTFERDADEDVDPETGLLLIQNCSVALDQAGSFQCAHAAQAGRLGQVHSRRKVAVGEAAFALQDLQD